MRSTGLSVCLVCLLQFQIVLGGTLPEGIITIEARAAPALSLADMDGKTKTLAASRGRWAFVHFWASWCGPCRKEIPSIARLLDDMQGKEMSFYIVNTAESDDTVFEFLGSTAPELNTLMDRDGLATDAWQPRGLPASYLVDPNGMLRYQALGGRNWQAPAYRDFLLGLINNK